METHQKTQQILINELEHFLVFIDGGVNYEKKYQKNFSDIDCYVFFEFDNNFEWVYSKQVAT